MTTRINDLTIIEACDKYVTWLREARGLSAHTQRAYRSDVLSLARSLGPNLGGSGAIPFPPSQPNLDVTMRAVRPPAAKKRRGVLIGALLGALILIAGGIFAAVKLTGKHVPSGGASGLDRRLLGGATLRRLGGCTRRQDRPP